jgi:hypothetical protein
MLKSTLGLTVLLGAMGPVAEDRGGRVWTNKSVHLDAYHSSATYADHSSTDAPGTTKFKRKPRSIRSSTSRLARFSAICLSQAQSRGWKLALEQPPAIG